MAKWICSVCGYVHEGDTPPEKLPRSARLRRRSSRSRRRPEELGGRACCRRGEGLPDEIIAGLRMNFQGECTEVGMYLAMARVAHREGYPEIGLYWERRPGKRPSMRRSFAELLGEVVTDSTKKNLEMRVEAENGATAGKFELAKLAKQLNLDAIHDTVHEMARDEARHGKAFEGLLKRYFA